MIPDIMVCLSYGSHAVFLALPPWLIALPGDGWGFAGACALNVLTKGLIGVVFPLAIVIVFLWLTRQPWPFAAMAPNSVDILIFLAIALPWHVAAGVANPTMGHPVGATPTQGNVHGFFWFYFVNEHLLRYLNRRIPQGLRHSPADPLLGTLGSVAAPC